MRLRGMLVALVFLVFWAGGGWAQEVPTTATEEEVTEEIITPQEVQVIVVSSKDTFLVYENQELLNFISDMPANPVVYTKFEDLLGKGGVNRFIYIVDNTVLDSLNPSDITTLAQLATGGTPMGIFGDSFHLKSVLGFQDAENTSVEDEVNSGSPQISFICKTSDGTLRDFSLSLEGNTTAGKLVKDLFKWYTGLITDSSTAKGGDDWPLITNGSQRYTGDMSGGTAALLMDIRKDPNSTDHLVSLTLESAIDQYSCDPWAITFFCGWYTSNMELTVTLSYGLQGYVPTGDVGSGTASYQVGIPASVGYGVSYNFTDITVRNNSSIANNKAAWVLSFNRPSYRWYPWISEPPYNATHTYPFYAQLYVRKDLSKKLKICTTAKVETEEDHAIIAVVKPIKATWNRTFCKDI